VRVREQCAECDVDLREENDGFFGVRLRLFMADLGPACGDPAPWWNRSRTLSPLLQFDFMERDGIEAPPTGQNKDNVYQCKKHSSAGTALRPFSSNLLPSLSCLPDPNYVTHVFFFLSLKSRFRL